MIPKTISLFVGGGPKNGDVEVCHTGGKARIIVSDGGAEYERYETYLSNHDVAFLVYHKVNK